MNRLAPLRHQSHPLRGLTYNLRRLLAPRALIDIRLPQQHLKFSLPVGSIFARLLYKYGEYERQVSNWLIAHHAQLGPGLFIDVGANFGWYSCLLSALDRERQILAFEPEPDNFRLLEAQLAMNAAGSVQALNKGLGAQRGHLEMFKYKDGNSGRHSMLPVHDGERVLVDIVTLDEQLEALQLAEQPIALMKMDIEGYELFALQGAQHALKRTRRLILEFSPDLMRRAQLDPNALLDLLASQGFSAQVFEADGESGPRAINDGELRELGRLGRQFDLLLESASALPLRPG